MRKIKSKLLLEIKNLQFQLKDRKKILDGVDLKIPTDEIHVLMGPNGSGKSTLAKIIMGIENSQKGQIIFKDKKISDSTPDERARLGIFLANQYPIEVPGVNLANFIQIAYNSRIKDKAQHLSPIKFAPILEKALKLVGLQKEFAQRNLNEGFSGGEKKKCEILQMAILQPELVILDETDSGLDVDALKHLFTTISKIKRKNKDMSLLIITHYNRIFKYIEPDKIHLLKDGKIIKTGGVELIKAIDANGFTDNK